MRMIYNFIGETLHKPSSEGWERATFWFGLAIAGLMAGIMLYAWWIAPAF